MMVIKLDTDQKRSAPQPSETHAASVIYVDAWKRQPLNPAEKLLSANERTSISALIAYVAWKAKESEYGVERRLSDRFNVPNMTCLPADQFDNAIRYLVDGLEVRG